MDAANIYEEVMAAVGGPVRLAQELGESSGTVCNWKARGFPAHRCKAIEALSGISVKRLLPDSWQDFWPEEGA